MISSVTRQGPELSQLITTRKVGRPSKDRAGSSAPVGRKPSRNPDEPDVEESLLFYSPDASGGMKLNRYTPTGQYIDTYA